MVKSHPLINTLLNLKGNPKACVLTEPFWGVPYNLFAPYASIYMYALGITDRQIGLIASIGMAFQIISALMSGIITDKLGRRKTTYVFDVIGWSIPCLIWAFSSSFFAFAAAAVISSIVRITMNSWGCLLVEDCDKEQIVNIYAWIYISGLIAAFFAPISGFFISRFDLIPTVRVLYIIAFILMTFKFYILNKYSTETVQGRVRMEETKNISIIKMLGGYGRVVRQILKTRETMLTLGIMLIMSICTMINGTFWSIYVTEKLHLPDSSLGVFPFVKSSVMLIFFFTVVPKIQALRFRNPLIIGFSSFVSSQLLLIFSDEKNYLFITISVLLEACSLSMINPLLDSMQVLMVDPKERARIMAILYVIVIALTSPFGWIGGVLSGLDRRLPFVMNIILLAAGAILTLYAWFVARNKEDELIEI